MRTPPRPPRRRPTPPPPRAGLLAPHLRAWRLHRGLTSVQLAVEARTGYPTVSRAENGHLLKPHTLKTLATVLGVPVGALLAEAPSPPPPPPGTALVLRTRSRPRVLYRAAPIREPQRTDPLYLRHLVSFPAWLLAQQLRPDRIGAIARAADADPELRCLAAESAPIRRPTSPDLREAWAAWGRWRRHHRRRDAAARPREAEAGGRPEPA